MQGKKRNKLILLGILLCFVFLQQKIFAQSGLCTENTPFYKVNLVGNPGGTWTSSPPIVRAGSCCGSQWPDRCIEFQITLDPNAVAINFEIASGAVPPGAMYYQIGCGPLTKVGEPICVDGPGPHTLTFCKPGANLNTYAITSIPGPSVSPDVTTSENCGVTISAYGLDPASVTFTDITSGTGAYNSFLSCKSGCTSTTVTPKMPYPAYVDYKVCGTPTAKACLPNPSFCDIIRVNFIPPITNVINPNPASFCANGTNGVQLTGIIEGGAAPFTYTWKNASGTVLGSGLNYQATISGTYSLEVTDATYPRCPSKTTSVNVTVDPVPVVDAGSDVTICSSTSGVRLAGIVKNAKGGTWTGGAGTFTPDRNTLNAVYAPSPTEITAGSVILTLTSTGTGSCAAVSDQMVIKITKPLVVTLSAPQVACFGSTVDIKASVTGGTSPYGYKWSTGQTSSSILNQPAGSYSLIVTDATASPCVSSVNITIPENPQIIAKTSGGNIISCESSTAEISVTASGGSGDFTYLWDTDETSQTIVVSSGTYKVTVSDASGCTATDQVTVNAVNSTLQASINQPTENVCAGAKATITANATGGFGTNYIYKWSTGQTSSQVTVGAGNYCVTVQDAGGCISTACATVYQDAPLVVTIPTPGTVCNGAGATVTPSVSGGKPPYSFSWNTGEKVQTITKPAGTYIVTVTDGNLNKCTANASVTISQAPALTLNLTSTDVSCNGGADGVASMIVSGGVQPYNYTWSPSGGTAVTAYNLAAGSYTAVVKDGIGCSKSGIVTINQPTPLVVSGTSTTGVSCKGGANGSASVTAGGGTMPYSYNWFPSGGSSSTASNLTAGTYSVTVTDAKGCILPVPNIAITEPVKLTATISSSSNVNCFGGNTGNATVTATGGVPGYTYSWSPSGGTGAVASALPAGNYTVTVKDSKGCQANAGITITQPNSLQASIPAASVNDVTCFGGADGSATVSVTGGTPKYKYKWSPGGDTSATVTQLSAQSYTVTVTDAKGCISSSSVTIKQNPKVNVTASPDIFVTCESTGTISAVASGGNGVYTYTWSNGDNTSSTSVRAGIYIVTATDGKGCSAQDTTEVKLSNSTLQVDLSAPANICNGSLATATASVSGGAAPFSYSWNTGEVSNSISVNGGFHCVTVTDNSGCVASSCKYIKELNTLVTKLTDFSVCKGGTGTILPVITGGLAPYKYFWSTGENTKSIVKGAGTYSLNITDSIGCISNGSVKITEAPDLVVSFTDVHDVSCINGNDGYATASPIGGGTTPYYYTWTPSGNSTATAYGLTAGTYSVKVTSSMGCIGTGSITITQPAAALTLTASSVNVSCFGMSDGTAKVDPSGGTAPYSYLWWEKNEIVNTISGLSPGAYHVSVSDNNGCVEVATYTITQPMKLEGSIASVSVSCYGKSDGTATATVNGGTAPYTYAWSPVGGNAATANNLNAGTYSLKVQDKNGCNITIPATIAEPTILNAQIQSSDIKDVTCSGGLDGSARVVASGGTTPYSYSWSPTGGNTDYAIGLGSGNYTVSVTDKNGCKATATASINEPNPLLIDIGTVKNVSCYKSSSDGAIALQAKGGTPGYTYSWFPSGGNTATALNLSAGAYTVTIADVKGCKTSTSIVIVEPPELKASIDGSTLKNISCFGGGDGQAMVVASGGTPLYTYSWSPSGGSDPTATGLKAGTYVATVIDSSGCKANTSITLTEPTQLSAVLGSGNYNLSCNGGSDGAATINVTGGTPAYSYVWTPKGSTTSSASGLTAGSYTIVATDAKGCKTTANFTISEPPALKVATVQDFSNGCFDGTNGRGWAKASGGTKNYTYKWNPTGATDSIAENLVPGKYAVLVQDAKGCFARDTLTIGQADLPKVYFAGSDVTHVSCYGGNDGKATVTVTGGAAPFSYSWSPSGGSGTTATNLSAGTYKVSVSDSKGCKAPVASVAITQPSVLQSSIALSAIKSVSCYGGQDGSATVSVSGGTAPYSYSWSPSGGSGITAYNMNAGDYTMTVQDGKGCISKSNVSITQPAELKATIDSANTTNVSCYGGNDGSAAITVTGGVKPYSYSWSSGSGSGPSIGGLSQGTYYVTGADKNNCPFQQSFTITAPSPLSSKTTSFPARCISANGSALVEVSGGTTPYSYLWSSTQDTTPNISNVTSGLYTVTIIDSRGCNKMDTASVDMVLTNLSLTDVVSNVACNGKSDGSITTFVSKGTAPYTYVWNDVPSNNKALTNIPKGLYSLKVLDVYGCSVSKDYTITEPPVLENDLVVNNISCFGKVDGSAVAMTTGGTMPYTYIWSTGANTKSISGLKAGAYTFKVTDAKGCAIPQSFTIEEPGRIDAFLSSSRNICFQSNDGMAAIGVSGGTPAYSYYWSPGGYTNAIQNNLSAGTYIVTVSDANKCSDTALVRIRQNPPLRKSVSALKHVSCNGREDGEIALSVTDGTPGYSYYWTPSVGTTSNITNLKAGTYKIRIVDNNGCELNDSIKVNEPPPLPGITETNYKVCVGQKVTIGTVSRPNYTYSWSPATNLSSSTDPVTVFSLSDTAAVKSRSYVLTSTFNGCSRDDSIKIKVYPKLKPDAGPDRVICLGEEIKLNATGGTGFAWENEVDNRELVLSPQGTKTYYVRVYNDACSGWDSVRVSVFTEESLSLFVPSAFSPNQDGHNEVFTGKSEMVTEFKGKIFNRWGELYHEWNNINDGWDGKYAGDVVQEDVYIYIFDVKTKCSIAPKRVMGTVTVVK